MEAHVFPEQQRQLVHYLRRLKEVFDVCDEDDDGFIRVEHLEHLGVQFGQGDEVSAGRARAVCRSVTSGRWHLSSGVTGAMDATDHSAAFGCRVGGFHEE